MTLLRLAIIVCAALTLCAATPAEEVRLQVTSQGGGTLLLEGSFEVAAPPKVAWAVLTDYARLADIVSSIETSRVVSRQDGRVQLYQEAVGRVLMFSRRLTVLLNIREEPMHRIEFIDVMRKDFELYRGGWRLQTLPGGVRVRHEVTARPVSAVPGRIIAEAFKATARDLLEQIRKEILLRARPA